MIGTTPRNHPMGITGEWIPRFRVTAPLVVARDLEGRLHHCYRGSLLGWLRDNEASHFLNKGLVERIDGAAVPKLPATETITECVAALTQLGVPLNAGAPTARSALRSAAHKYSSEVVAAAVRQRKLVLARQTGDDDEDFEEVIVS
jgi:cytochrome c oxidase cbb3-type subunit II